MRQALLMKDSNNQGFTVVVPSVPGCAVHGRSVDEALAKARAAIEERWESLAREGQPPPGDAGDALEVAII